MVPTYRVMGSSLELLQRWKALWSDWRPYRLNIKEGQGANDSVKRQASILW